MLSAAFFTAHRFLIAADTRDGPAGITKRQHVRALLGQSAEIAGPCPFQNAPGGILSASEIVTIQVG